MKTKLKELGEIVQFKRGYDLPSYNRIEGIFPIISSSGITGYHNQFKAEGEGIITGRYGTLGEMFYINGKYWPHNTALYAIDFKDNYPKYVYYLLQSLNRVKTSDKSTVPGINRNDLHQILIPFVEGNETQQKIASVLSSLDAKIELNNRINAELEAMAKTLYDYWFVQFDFPNAEGKPYKSSGGAMVWSEELKREIPQGWEVKILGDYAKSTGGYAFKSSAWVDTGLPVIKIKDIQEDYTLNLNDISKVDCNTIIDKKFVANAGDVVIAMTGATIGKYAIVPIHPEQIFVNQRVGVFKLGDKPVKRLAFLINSLRQSYFRESIYSLANGAAQPNISNEQINSISLLFPDKKLIENFNNCFESTYERILNNQQENQQLAHLRDWLLPMLMNGQVVVE